MKAYEIRGPCPELATVLAKAAVELGPGEEAKIVSRWRYVVHDVKNSAGYIGLEVVDVKEGPSHVEIVIRKSAQARHLLRGRET
jgi:heme-degrading monooxygenase HmoA